MDLGYVGEKVRTISKEIIEKGGFEFVHFEIAGTKRSPVVRVFVDRSDGLSVEHCADISREIEARLDEQDLIPSKYVLEVSSPGLERELYSLNDFSRFSGKLVKIKTDREFDGSKNFVGYVGGVNGDDVRIDIRDGKEITLPFSSIVKANLKIDLDAEFRKR